MEKARTILEVHGLLAKRRGRICKMSRISADLTGRSRNVRGSARNPRVQRVKQREQDARARASRLLNQSDFTSRA